MIPAKKYAEAYLLINFPVWFLGLFLFFIYANDYAGEYALGSLLMIIGVMACTHCIKKCRYYIEKLTFFPRSLLFSSSIFAASLTLIGLVAKINGDSPAAAFALPASLGSACYRYLYLLKKENRPR
ncbi:hypothetical protein [Paraburkholderia bonniea]|uniref:hypothetical protein n=1 Tax=Paraburkholderia bonniea TaxID=2152891 RepID=UPI001290C2F9|nr:hypothetical protein [Paraburkholderia bonniea]